jgi:FemAB-related protein (PEP-CTERM system-associated)
VTRLDAADTPAWDQFVSLHPQATSYHLSGWQQVLHKAFGHTSHHLVAKRGARVVGVLPLVQLKSALFGNFMVSMPFLNYGGVLAHDDAARTELLDHAVTLAKALTCSHLELRETTPSLSWPMRTDKVSMWLPLPANQDALWAQIGSKLRAQIKKGTGHGLTFEVGGVALLDDFYRVFSTNMRDLGTPVYAKRFFEIVLKQAPGTPELVVGKDPQGRAVAGALVLRHGDRMEVPWASTLREANSLNANMALYWTMLSHAREAGCTTFDFGRSTVDASTHRFKKQWGAHAVPLYWHYWMADGKAIPQINPGNSKYRLAIAAWKHLPLTMANQMGPRISRSVP